MPVTSPAANGHFASEAIFFDINVQFIDPCFQSSEVQTKKPQKKKKK
jgi:hypothetical protein